MAGNSPVDRLFGDSGSSAGASPLDRLFGGLADEADNSFAADIPAPTSAAQDTRGRVDRLISNYDPIVDEAARAHGLDPRLMKSIMQVESSGNPNAQSSKGAVGLFQMTPIAVKEVNRQFGTDYTDEDRFDPAKNADMGAKYFGLQLKKAGGDTELALRYYNGGYNRERWGKENAAYAGKVFAGLDDNFNRDFNDKVDMAYAGDVLRNVPRYNETGDFGRRFSEAFNQGQEDKTSGMAGYLQNLMGDTQGAERNYQNLQRLQDEARQSAKPQDQWSGVDLRRPSEILDYLQGNAGNALGSSVGPLAAGAAGFAIGGPVGGLIGAGIPLAAQYIGNTWGGAVDRRAQGGVTPGQAIADMSAGDLARIGAVGVARGGVELAGDVAGLAGGGVLQKMLPTSLGGAAVNLLDKAVATPLRGIGFGSAGEAAQEVADVPLEAIGTGRPLSEIRRSEYTDAAAGGLAGGGMLSTGGQMVTNPRGLAANVAGLRPGEKGANYRPDYGRYVDNHQAYSTDPALSQSDYAQGYYNDRALRQKTRAGDPGLNAEGTIYDKARIAAEAEALAQERAAAQLAEEEARQAEARRIPSVKELHAKMLLDHQAEVDARKAKEPSEDEYNAELDAHLEQDPDGANIPPHLESFKAYKDKFKKDAKGQPKLVPPTLSDAAKQRQQIIQDRFANPQDMVGPRDNELARSGGQLDMFGGGWQLPSTAQEEAPQGQVADPRQMEIDYGRSGYAGRRLLTHSGDIFAGQEPTQEPGGQLDMFGGGGQLPSAPVEDPVQTQEVDPRQQSIRFPINDAASNRKYEAAFNQAEREAAQQKARDEAKASQVTRNKNVGTLKAQEQIANQDVQAETPIDQALGRRQVRKLNKAQAAAEKARQDAEKAKEQSHQDTIREFNSALREPIQAGDRLKTMPDGSWQLYPTRRIGRPPKGHTYEKMYLKDGTLAGHVLRPVTEQVAPEVTPEVASDVGPNVDQIIADKLAEQQKLLDEKDAQKAKPKTRKVKAAPKVTEETPDAKLDALIKKIDSVEMKPKAAEKRKATPAEQKQLEQDMLGAAADDYASVERTDNLGELDFDYSLTEDGKANTPTDAGRVGKTVEDLTGKQSNWKVIVHNTVAEAEQTLGRPLKKNAKAFVTNGKAHFILENIPKGSELGVFLHEVGAHLGMERILSAEQRSRLASKIQQWAESGKGVEGEAARAAMKRAGDNQKEQIAYFVEEAVNRGVNPTALDMKSDVGRWFRQLWAAMKTALRRLGIKNIDNLSAQDVVNLAYGAARLELSGNWHGSAKNFNKFSNKHRGTGEGGLKEGSDGFKDMIAFGQYFAGKRGTAEGYRDRHSLRAVRGPSVYAEWGDPWELVAPDGSKFNMDDLPEDGPINATLSALDQADGDFAKARRILGKAKRAMERASQYSQVYVMEDARSELDRLQKAGYVVRPVPTSGTLFNVDFNIKDDEWLDWDKPVLEQSEKLRSNLRIYDRMADIPSDEYDDPFTVGSVMHGESFYRNLSYELGSEKAASEYLNSIGIKGVRYLDAQSRRRGAGTYNYVVFDPKNVVVGNKNSERIESDDIQYSLNDHLDKVYPELKSYAGGFSDFVKDAVVSFNGIPQLAKWLPHLKSLQDIHVAEEAMNDAYNDMAESTQAIVDRMRELPDRVQRGLSRLMIDATLERIHPDVDFEDESNAHLKGDAMAKLAHTKLAADYAALPADAKKVYASTRDLFQTMLERRKDALVALTKEFSGSAEADKMRKALNALSKQMAGPYFPLMRFGNHIAVWRSKEYTEAEEMNDKAGLARMQNDPQHYMVSFEETSSAAQEQVKAWIKENGLDRTDTKGSRVIARSDFQGGVNQSLEPLLAKMESALDTTLGENAKDAKEAIRNVFISALPDNSIFKSAIKRRNVRGVKEGEMMRAIASHGGSQAFHISRLEHSHQIQKGLVDLRSEDTEAVNTGKQLSSIHPALSRAIGGLYEQDPSTVGARLAGGLTSSLYYSRLALNPAFWVTSFMSPTLVSVPYMNGRHGMASSYRAWSKGALDAAKIVTLKHFTQFSFKDQIAESRVVTDGERDMLLAVERAGGIDQTALRELNNVARGAAGKVDDLKRVLGAAAHRVEVVSRISTALAAYRLELKRTGDQQAATDYAVEVVNNTLINYTHAHTPLILRKGGALSGPVAKVVFQFARYQVGMMNLIGHNLREAWFNKDADEKTREEARRQFFALSSIHALATGASGAFGYNFLVGAANMVVGMLNPDDEPADIEAKARKILDDLSVEISGSKNLSIALRRGLPAVAGFDLSSRMGMGDMLSPRRENPFKGDKAEMAAGLVGVIPGASHFLDWMSWAKDPKIKTFPVSLVSNFAKAYELADQGMLNKHGVVKKGSEDFNPVDIMLQGMGFPPTELNEAYTNQASARTLDKSIMSARQKLLDDFNNAVASGDRDKVSDVRKNVQEFNSRHRGQADVVISVDTLTKSRKQRLERERRMNSEGVYIPKKGTWRRNNFTEEETP